MLEGNYSLEYTDMLQHGLSHMKVDARLNSASPHSFCPYSLLKHEDWESNWSLFVTLCMRKSCTFTNWFP